MTPDVNRAGSIRRLLTRCNESGIGKDQWRRAADADTRTGDGSPSARSTERRSDSRMQKRKRVAIIGFASSSRDQAPYADESFEIWSLNHAYTHVPRWDRWFEVHPKAHFQRDLLRDGMPQDGKRHMDWLKQEPAGGRPIYCQEHYDDIPASVRFPREEINEWLRKNGGQELEQALPDGFFVDDYYTSTPAEMLALALYEGFEEIHLYGIDMLQAEEWGYQRSGCEYYVGFARGRGIKVYIPQTSALCKANYVYGYSEPPTDIAHVQPYVEYLGTKISESDLNKQKAASIANTLDGGLQMARLVLEMIDKGVVLRDADGKPVKREDQDFADRRPATLADVKAECEAQIKKLEVQAHQAQNTVVAMDGQLAGFRCSQSWIEHYARGGKLA